MTGVSLQLIVFLLVLAASGLKWLLGQLAEARARKEAQQREQTRRDEILRTGRDPSQVAASPSDEADANARLREIAARRQAQLRELRRRQAGDDPAPAPPVVVGLPPAPAAPTLPRPARPVSSPRPIPTPTPAPRPAPRRPATASLPAPARPAGTPAEFLRAEARRRNAEQRAAAEARQRAQQNAIQAEIDRPRPRRSTPSAAAATGAAMPRHKGPVMLPGTTDWRAALIASEVLGRPVALRPPADEAF